MHFDSNGWCDVEQAIKKTEWHFENEFDTRDFAARLNEKGWSLDYLYLEQRKMNRYEVDFSN
jgi:hypothetical protein